MMSLLFIIFPGDLEAKSLSLSLSKKDNKQNKESTSEDTCVLAHCTSLRESILNISLVDTNTHLIYVFFCPGTYYFMSMLYLKR